MAFKSDAQGFLVGELVDSRREMAASQERGMRVWREIRTDVKSIARAMGVQVSAGRRAAQPVAGAMRAPGVPATPAGRRGAASGGAQQAISSAGRGGGTRGAQGRAATLRRDTSGRFTAGMNGPRSAKDKDEPGLAVRVGKTAIKAATPDNFDPYINALKEVVGPVGRGMAGLFGRGAERKKERWYQRLWASLKSIDRKADGGRTSGGVAFGAGGGGSGGLVPALLGGLLGGKGAGLLATLLGRGKGLVKGGFGLLRRLPVLGALISGGLALGSAFGMNDDPSKSDEENRAARYRTTGEAAGMGIGGTIGAVLGSALGPLGTLAGGYLGALLGERVGGAIGDWTKSLMDSDVPGKMVAAWEGAVSTIKSTWDSLKETAGTLAENAKKEATSLYEKAKTAGGQLIDKGRNDVKAVNDEIKKRTGVDPLAITNELFDKGKQAVQQVASAAVPATLRRAAAATTNGIRRVVVANGGGFNIVEREDGTIERQAGARNWRNNNPGNIEYGPYARSKGAIGSDGRFAIFPDYETGRAAKADLLFEGARYKNLDLKSAIARYAPPSENNTAAYQSAVLAAVGGKNKKLSEFTPEEQVAIMDAMQRVEGYKAGKVSTVSMPPIGRPATTNSFTLSTLRKFEAGSMPSLTVADIPPAPAIVEVAAQADATRRERPIQVVVPERVGQNVQDRGIAHITSGGLGGS